MWEKACKIPQKKFCNLNKNPYEPLEPLDMVLFANGFLVCVLKGGRKWEIVVGE